MLPSKELLTEVLSYPVVEVKEINFNCVYYGVDSSYSRMYGEEIRDINMYELMHYMKEWIGKTTDFDLIVIDTTAYLDDCDSLLNKGGFYYKWEAYCKTEFEAVTKACEWILEQHNVSE